jgi:hypothetical protein
MDKQNTGNTVVFTAHHDDPNVISRIGDAKGSFETRLDLWTLLFGIEHLWLREIVVADLPDGTVCDSIQGTDETQGPQRRVTLRLNRVEYDAGRVTDDRLGAAALREALRLLATPLREEIDNSDGASSVSLRMDELLEALTAALHPLDKAAWERVRLRYFQVMAGR